MPLGAFRLNSLGKRRGPPPFAAIQATGGTTQDVTINGVNYRIHTFTSSDNFNVTNAGSEGIVDILLVGGGGGGGSGGYGSAVSTSGGAGGYVYSADKAISSQSYAITVGAGGAPGIEGVRGGASTGLSLTAGGGQSPASTSSAGTSGSPQNRPNGNGRQWSNPNYAYGGGGAGAGGNGGSWTSNGGGAGGVGISNGITGTNVIYAAGTGGYGGLMTRGADAPGSNYGRGGFRSNNGFEGIVIIRYKI